MRFVWVDAPLDPGARALTTQRHPNALKVETSLRQWHAAYTGSGAVHETLHALHGQRQRRMDELRSEIERAREAQVRLGSSTTPAHFDIDTLRSCDTLAVQKATHTACLVFAQELAGCQQWHEARSSRSQSVGPSGRGGDRDFQARTRDWVEHRRQKIQRKQQMLMRQEEEAVARQQPQHWRRRRQQQQEGGGKLTPAKAHTVAARLHGTHQRTHEKVQMMQQEQIKRECAQNFRPRINAPQRASSSSRGPEGTAAGYVGRPYSYSVRSLSRSGRGICPLLVTCSVRLCACVLVSFAGVVWARVERLLEWKRKASQETHAKREQLRLAAEEQRMAAIVGTSGWRRRAEDACYSPERARRVASLSDQLSRPTAESRLGLPPIAAGATSIRRQRQRQQRVQQLTPPPGRQDAGDGDSSAAASAAAATAGKPAAVSRGVVPQAEVLGVRKAARAAPPPPLPEGTPPAHAHRQQVRLLQRTSRDCAAGIG